MLLLQMMGFSRVRIGNKPERAIDKQFVNHESSVCVLSLGFTVRCIPHLWRLLPKRRQFETSEWDVTDTIFYIQTVVKKHYGRWGFCSSSSIDVVVLMQTHISNICYELIKQTSTSADSLSNVVVFPLKSPSPPDVFHQGETTTSTTTKMWLGKSIGVCFFTIWPQPVVSIPFEALCFSPTRCSLFSFSWIFTCSLALGTKHGQTVSNHFYFNLSLVT